MLKVRIPVNKRVTLFLYSVVCIQQDQKSVNNVIFFKNFVKETYMECIIFVHHKTSMIIYAETCWIFIN